MRQLSQPDPVCLQQKNRDKIYKEAMLRKSDYDYIDLEDVGSIRSVLYCLHSQQQCTHLLRTSIWINEL